MDVLRHTLGSSLTVLPSQIHTVVSPDGEVDGSMLEKLENIAAQPGSGVVVEFGYDVHDSCWRPKCVRRVVVR